MGSGQVFRPHFTSPLHPWLGSEKGMVGSSSPSWHSPFTKTSAQYPHSTSSPAPHSNSYSSSGLFSAFSKDDTGATMGSAVANPPIDYNNMSSGDDLKGTSMLSPNKSGREGLPPSAMGVGGDGSLIPPYPTYPGSLSGDFHNPYYPQASHFNKDKPKNKPRSSAGKRY